MIWVEESNLSISFLILGKSLIEILTFSGNLKIDLKPLLINSFPANFASGSSFKIAADKNLLAIRFNFLFNSIIAILYY